MRSLGRSRPVTPKRQPGTLQWLALLVSVGILAVAEWDRPSERISSPYLR